VRGRLDAQKASQKASKTQAKHTQDDILKEIQYLRHTYGAVSKAKTTTREISVLPTAGRKAWPGRPVWRAPRSNIV
jgi:hypothetical protein